MTQGNALDGIGSIMDTVRRSGLLSSVCTIYRFPEGDDSFDAGGAPIAAYEAVTGLTNIPCIASPIMTTDRLVPYEVRRMSETQSNVELHVLLNGYYAGILESDRAVVDGVTYDITAIESDSQKKMSRLAVKRVTK